MTAPGWELRPLGATGLRVTPLAFGAMELRGPPRGKPVDDEQAEQVLNAVLDAGVNIIDTAIDYGRAEELIGRYVSHRRDEYVLASKCGCLVGWQPIDDRKGSPHEYSRDNIVAGVEQSLRRMRTDHLDLVQVHMSPAMEVLENNAVVETLLELRDSGKVLHIGMSGTLPNVVEHLDLGVFEVLQVPFSMTDQAHEEIVAKAAAANVGVLARGVLKGRGEHSTEELLRFAAGATGVTAALFGTSSADHARANIAALTG